MNLLPPFQTNKYLKDISTFGIGGPARLFVEVFETSQMQAVLCYCFKMSIPFFVIGKGSNCLFDDRGFDGLIIQNKISYLKIDGCEVDVGAGYSFSMLGNRTAKLALGGLEFASGIPATVGGAVFMNAGANGQETSETLFEVSFVDEEGLLHSFTKENLQFGYRFSSFQTKKGAIVSAKFRLEASEIARGKQLSIIDYRTQTQPYGDLSIGCFFRNPRGDSAGSLIEKAGLKGLTVGGAEVSHKHANFIVNKQNAIAHDVLILAKQVQQRVKESMGVELELEVRCIPYQI